MKMAPLGSRIKNMILLHWCKRKPKGFTRQRPPHPHHLAKAQTFSLPSASSCKSPKILPPIRIILHNKGALVTGAAGTGKTVGVLHKLRGALNKRGKNAHACAYTHAAARLVGGVTIARRLKCGAPA